MSRKYSCRTPHHLVLGLSIVLFGLLAGSPAFAQLTPMVSFPQGQTTAGDVTALKVYFHNEGNIAQTALLPAQLQFLITDENGETMQLSAFSDVPEKPTVLPPGSFRIQTYSLKIPGDISGIVHYQIGGFKGASGMFLVHQAEKIPVVATTKSSPQKKLEEDEENLSLRNLASLYQSYSANFSAYEPTYFLVGTDPEKSKFQISFKYRLFNPSGSLSRRLPWMEGFHIAYTQTSFWDLDSDSIPFEDTSYKPEFFYLSSNIGLRPSWMDGFFIQTGIEHESNGRGGDLSRSTNYGYIKPMFIYFHQPSQLGIMISPRFLSYFNTDEDNNPDIEDYRGKFEVETRIGKAHSLLLTTNLRFADEGTSVQADLSYPIHRLLGNNLDIYFHIQYSNALAESLINYRERTEALRIGISLVR